MKTILESAFVGVGANVVCSCLAWQPRTSGSFALADCKAAVTAPQQTRSSNAVRVPLNILNIGLILPTLHGRDCVMLNVSSGPELLNYPDDCVSGNKLQLTFGNRILYGAPGHTMYNHIRVPNDPQIDCRGGLPHSPRNDYWWTRLSHNITSHSKHVGGVHSLFCDGHVQFISNSIDGTIWQSLGSRSGGEVVGEF